MPKNIVLAKLDIDTQALMDSARKIAKEIQALTEQQDKLTRKGKEGSEQFIAIEAALKSLTTAHKAQTAALAAQTNEDERLSELVIAQQVNKAKNMQEELTIAERIASKKKKIAEAEYHASAKTANDKLNLQIKNAGIENGLMARRANVAVANADAELKKFIENNQSKLKDGQFLSEELVNSEKKKLDDILNAEEANNGKKQQLDAKRKEEQKTQEAIDLENKRAEDSANYDYNLGVQLERLDEQKAQELDAAEKTGADKELIEKKYARMRSDSETAVMNNKLDLANSTFSNLTAIMGKESAAGKAMAVAQATIDTYKSAVAAYSAMSGIPIVGPALGAVAAGTAVATGIANVKKISSTKPPKAEKGALFNIGGNRHSRGGTMFTGADGTQFEAEQGELIGGMNRNAARHFMAFNNAFPAGGASAPNYFAGGGIVSREIAQQSLNTDELALKIAEANRSLPPPVVAVQDIVTEGNSYVRVRDAANF